MSKKGKSSLGLTKVALPLNHNYSCISNSCDDAHFEIATSLTVNPSFDCDSVSNVCNDNISSSDLFVSSDNLTVSGCVNYDNLYEIENDDISHEMPFTITKNENIPPTNHINTIESIVSNDKASNSNRGKMVKFEYKRKSIANKPLYKNKQEAEKD